MRGMRLRSVGGLTIKAVLVLGFGLMLGLWLFAGYDFTRRMAELQGDAEAINERYMRAQELLSSVRAQVLLGSVYVRDALLDPDPDTIDRYRRQLDATHETVGNALRQYVPVLDAPSERGRVATLSREIDAFHKTMRGVLASDRSRWPAEARLVLNTQVVPKREVVFRVSEEVQALNRRAFVRQQGEIAALYRDTQQQVWQQLGFALAAGVAIALLATVYAGRLENRLRRQQAMEARTSNDLQRLSAKLVSVQEDERRTIARELHDEVGQVLTAIKMELSLAQRKIERNGGPRDLLGDAQRITDGALHTVRDLSHLLHPAVLDDLGLPAAIDSTLREFGARHGIQVELLHDRMEERLSAETEAAAFRIVQEALTNVAKHAHATLCRIYLQRLPHTLLVTIEDDGAGFDAATAEQTTMARGLGLIGIRERAAQLHGTVSIESGPARGTRLTVELGVASRGDGPGPDEATIATTSAEAVPVEAIHG